MTERLENAVNQIKQYQLCYHCDYYDEDNMHCTAEDVNCVETIANQIGREIYNKALDDFDEELRLDARLPNWAYQIVRESKKNLLT